MLHKQLTITDRLGWDGAAVSSIRLCRFTLLDGISAFLEIWTHILLYSHISFYALSLFASDNREKLIKNWLTANRINEAPRNVHCNNFFLFYCCSILLQSF